MGLQSDGSMGQLVGGRLDAMETGRGMDTSLVDKGQLLSTLSIMFAR